MTPSEKKLWREIRLKNLGFKFRRQQVIGPYIIDFACLELKLLIEIDGGQHNENQHDEKRDWWLVNKGFRVLRFWNNDVMLNTAGVVEEIMKALPPTSVLPL